MGAEVEEIAGGGEGFFLPGVGALEGAVAVVVGADLDDAAEGAVEEQLADGEEVAVETAVVEGDDVFAAAGGEVDELAGLGGGGGEGLVDDDVLVGEEGDAGELDVGGVGCGDDDDVDGGVGEGLAGGVDEAGGGVALGGGLCGGTGDDGVEFEAGDGGDHGAVEDATGEAVADDGYAEWGAHMGIILLRRWFKCA